MPNTYTQLYIQLVFAVQGRQNLIAKQHRQTIHKYVTQVVQADGNKMLAVYCMPDHLHMLVGLNPEVSISNLVLDVKRATTNFINRDHIIGNHFHWQKGYGAFSYSRSSINSVVQYILNQEQHHQKITFHEEYIQFLKKYNVQYDEKYLFEFYDEASITDL
ncbi:IS200/IS605 family transposase [Aridibaculum aurantiacum]|uniref:IS200/IS605 family transposase n=1 Tax=Aridibaculum aurantiacum TaxID=2810307 RepID=UPI001A96A27A|nr:IS200/IS605 family transposase [Aridibaculum aurantiacum]